MKHDNSRYYYYTSKTHLELRKKALVVEKKTLKIITIFSVFGVFFLGGVLLIFLLLYHAKLKCLQTLLFRDFLFP